MMVSERLTPPGRRRGLILLPEFPTGAASGQQPRRLADIKPGRNLIIHGLVRMTTRQRTPLDCVLATCRVFFCLGVVFFVVSSGVAFWLEESGNTPHGLAAALLNGLLCALLWPDYLVRILLSASTETVAPDVPGAAYLLAQTLGWALLGIPVGIIRAGWSSGQPTPE